MIWVFSAPDKRGDLNHHAPQPPPKRLPYKRNNEIWNLEDESKVNNNCHDLRDSGISTTSLTDFQTHLTNLNNLSYEDFEPKSIRCHDLMNISSPSVITAMSMSTNSFTSSTFHMSQVVLTQEVGRSEYKYLQKEVFDYQ